MLHEKSLQDRSSRANICDETMWVALVDEWMVMFYRKVRAVRVFIYHSPSLLQITVQADFWWFKRPPLLQMDVCCAYMQMGIKYSIYLSAVGREAADKHFVFLRSVWVCTCTFLSCWHWLSHYSTDCLFGLQLIETIVRHPAGETSLSIQHCRQPVQITMM